MDFKDVLVAIGSQEFKNAIKEGKQTEANFKRFLTSSLDKTGSITSCKFY
jgi:hypothetical protein